MNVGWAHLLTKNTANDVSAAKPEVQKNPIRHINEREYNLLMIVSSQIVREIEVDVNQPIGIAVLKVIHYYFRYSAANIQQDFENEKKNIKKVLKAEELNMCSIFYK